MTHKTPFDELSADWSELDVLVLREFESLERRVGKPSPQTSSREEAQHDDSGVVPFRERAKARTPSLPDSMAEDETSLAPPDLATDGSVPDVGYFGPAPVAELFNAEDRAFIARSAEWLRGRPNKDMILSRIWEELQQTEPEDFFVPPEETNELGDADPEAMDPSLVPPSLQIGDD